MALSKKATIGIIVGIVALLLLLMIIAVIFDKKKLKSEDEKKKEEQKNDKKEDGKEKKTPPSKTQQPQMPKPKPVFKDLPKPPEPKKEKTDELYNKPVKKIVLSVPDLYREKIALPDISNKKDISAQQLNGKSRLTFQANIKEHQFNPQPPPPPQTPPPPPPGGPDPGPPPPQTPPPIKPINPNVPTFGTDKAKDANALDVE